MWTALKAMILRGWRRNVVAPDPDPRYSYLDRLDGLQRGSNAEPGLTERKARS